jgi:hypothetical protein
MSEFLYAQLDERDVCVGVSQLAGEVVDDRMIPIKSLNTDIVGRVYNRRVGTWGKFNENKLKSENRNTARDLLTAVQSIMEKIKLADELDMPPPLTFDEIEQVKAVGKAAFKAYQDRAPLNVELPEKARRLA